MYCQEYFRCPSTLGFSPWFWCQFVDHHPRCLGTRWVQRHHRHRCFETSLYFHYLHSFLSLVFLQHHRRDRFPKGHSTARLGPCNRLTFLKFRYFQARSGANRRGFRCLGLNSFCLPNQICQHCSRRKLVERLQFRQWIFLRFVLRLPFETAYIMHGPVAARSALDSEKRS